MTSLPLPIAFPPRRARRDLSPAMRAMVLVAGGVAKEFNTIAVDDGIAMGHDGMLYSLPSREIIADAVEYMVNAHCAWRRRRRWSRRRRRRHDRAWRSSANAMAWTLPRGAAYWPNT